MSQDPKSEGTLRIRDAGICTGIGSCYAYCRVSDRELANGNPTVDTQRVACKRAWDHRYKSYTWGGFYEDIGVNANVPLGEREAGGEMMTSLRRGDFVIATQSARLFRSLGNMVSLAREFMMRGVGIYLVGEGLELSRTDAGMKAFSVLDQVVQIDKDTYSHHVRDNTYRRRMSGKCYTKNPPLGFRALSDRSLVPFNEERVVMGRILEWSNQGSTMEQIVFFLKEQDCKRAQTRCFYTIREVNKALKEEYRLREIQRRVQAGELDPLLIPPQYRHMQNLPACADLFPEL